MRNVLLLFLLLTSFTSYAQYPEGLTDITAGLADGDDNFALTTEDERSGTFKSTLVIIGDNMFFTATSTNSGDELYITDGTEAGTKMVKDINPGSADASPRYLIALNGKLYFQADDGTNGVELWESDGTEAGTKMVADIYSGAESSAPDLLTAFDGKILFRATTVASSADAQKWMHIYDPGTETTTLLGEIQARVEGDAVIRRIQVDNTHNMAYFIGEVTGENQEIYKTDGTPAGTGKIMDITPESLGSSNIQWLYVHNDSLILWRQKTPRKYAGADSVNYLEHLHEQIWISDGTPGNTKMLKHFNKNVAGDGNGTNTQFAFPVSYRGKLYFRADDGVHGVELCETNCTEAGTFQIEDLTPGTGNSWPEDYAFYKGLLCFSSGAGNNGYELRYLDTVSNTIKLFAETIPGDGGNGLKRTTTFQYDGKDSLIFYASQGASTGGQELYVAYEIGDQAELVYELDPSGSVPHNLSSWKNALYFTTQKVNRLFRYAYTPAIKLIAEGSLFVDYSNMQDTLKVKLSKVNGENLTNHVVKIEPNDNSQLYKISKTKDGTFGFDAIYTGNVEVDSFYVIANQSVLDPDGFKWSGTLRAVNLNTDTLIISGRVVLEPVFRHELVYHVDIGNETDSITNSLDITGTHNSVFDQIYGKDTVSGKTWGYIASGWGWLGAGNKWNTMRERNYQEDPGGLKYKLEIEPGDYVVQIGWFENWGSRSQDVIANGVKVIEDTASLPSDYMILEFDVNIPAQTDSLQLVFKSTNENNAYFSWFKVGKKCTEANCDTMCFDPICDLRSGLYDTTSGGTSVSQSYAISNELKVYPNPARDILSIDANPEIYTSVAILDLTGKVVMSAPVNNSITKLNAADIGAGMYVVKAQGNQEFAITKIVITK